MDAARIAELLAPFFGPTLVSAMRACHSEPASAGEEPAFLSSSQLQTISTYIDLLLRWNARINLTSIRDPEAIVTRHFGESLFAARELFPFDAPVGTAAPPTLADFGSGAGFPGIPIKLWAPQISLTLIESSHKKSTFLREVVRGLTLTNVDVLNARAESLVGSRFDVVTSRAVEHFNAILPIAARLLRPGGRLALLIGLSQAEGVRLALPNLSWSSMLPVPLSNSRALLIGRSQPDLHESR